ncbi:MAG: hypothetical protein LBC72_01760 [Spirochaetaceae bacterium]|jgi:hypothetical protein|nr:hypothetical protein [Spirochaetaceae bacterium]
MKKFVLAGIVFLTLAGTFAYADHPDGFGIGIQGGGAGAAGFGNYGGDITLKIPSIPIFWAGGVVLFPGYMSISVSGDKYLIDNEIVSMLGWYFGLGVGAHIGMGSELGIAAAFRVPIGLTFQPVDMLELYLQVVPQIGLSILPGIGLWPHFWGGNLGIRLWF